MEKKEIRKDKDGFFSRDLDRREFFRAGAGIVLPSIALLGINITSGCSQAGGIDDGTGSIVATLADDQLGMGIWKEGSVNVNEEIWWFFNSSNGTEYSVAWDDSFNGSGSYTADVRVSAYDSAATTSYFYQRDAGYTTPATVTATETGPLYINVSQYGEAPGTFAVKVDYVGGGSPSCTDCTGTATSTPSCSDCTGGATGCSGCTGSCSASCRDSCHGACTYTCSGGCTNMTT